MTFSVLRAPSLSGQGTHLGVATSYLDSVCAGDTIHLTVRPSHAAFSLPTDPERTPLICIAAGAGLAPFRGFIQERAKMIASGRTLAPLLLFFGCRAPGRDDIYRDELDEWERLGAVDVRRAYSLSEEQSEGCRYVQDRIWRDRADLLAMWERGAKVFVCGSTKVAEAAREMMLKMRRGWNESVEGEEGSEEKDREWFEGLRNARYVTDVFD